MVTETKKIKKKKIKKNKKNKIKFELHNYKNYVF